MTAGDQTLRVFIATAISGEAYRALEQVIAGLRQEIPSGVTWVKPEGIHLTLKFLGNVKREPLSRLQKAVTSGVIAHSPFRLYLSGSGVFPNRRRPRVLWAGVQGELEALGGPAAYRGRRCRRGWIPPGGTPLLSASHLGTSAAGRQRRFAGRYFRGRRRSRPSLLRPMAGPLRTDYAKRPPSHGRPIYGA